MAQKKTAPKRDIKKYIRIRGAAEHNLKNIDLDIPRNEFVVMTGLSGSGKSSLAFDTIYAEGQRRYMESLSSYARQFLGQMEKPKVESIEGLPPRSRSTRSPRTTTRARQSERSRRFTIISGSCMQGAASFTVPPAGGRSKGRAWTRWSIR